MWRAALWGCLPILWMLSIEAAARLASLKA